MVAAENRVKEFRQTNMGLMPSDGANYYQRREGLAGQIREAELQLAEAQKRSDAIKRQLEDPKGASAEGDLLPPSTESMTPLENRIKILEEKLDQLLLAYTERHPDVVSTRRLLADLRKEREAEVASLRQAGGGKADARAMRNPVYQQLKVAQSAVDAEVAALKARVEEYQRRHEELGRLVNTVPQVEAELARLNRDYDIQRSNYQELVKRREALALSDQAGKASDEVQFNVVEPPRVPLKPASPDRPKLLAVVLAVGLGGGGGLAWLLGMIRPAIYSREGFREMTELPVLGSITRVSTAKEDRQHRLRILLFIGGFVGLLLAFGAVLMSEDRILAILARLH
jgi:polysaccharide chain length determinant protein (PEP-CTERM system associated)